MPQDISYYQSKITSEYQGSPNFLAWIGDQVQYFIDVQACVDSFLSEFNLNSAVGAQLDILGAIVGVLRNVSFQPSNGVSPILDDATYRTLIIATIARNHWNGQIDTLLDLWQSIFPGSLLIVNDHQDMTVSIYVGVGLTSILQDLVIKGYINQAAGGGKFCIATWDGFTGTPTFSNTAGDSWVMLDQWQDGSSFAEFATAYVKSSIGNATDKVTVNLSVTPNQLAVSCLSFTGQNSSAPLDTHVTGNSDGATTVTSSPFSTTGNPNELIIGGLGKYASSPTWTAGNIGGVGATIPSGATSTFKFASLEYLQVTSNQSGITADASASASGTAMGIGVATFK